MDVAKLPDIFLSTSDTRKAISRLARAGSVRKIAPRLYTKKVKDDPETLIRRNLWLVIDLLFPGTIISHRTALEMRPSPEGTVNLTGPYNRLVKLPGVTVRVADGPPRFADDQTFMSNLARSSEARGFLESLSRSRTSKAGSRSLPRKEIEMLLERKLASAGEASLNRIRDRAKEIAPLLGAEKELKELDAIVGALLGTRNTRLKAPAAIARAQGDPFDTHRIENFSILMEALAAWEPISRATPPGSEMKFANVAFIDSYFSNYIEGTEFEIEEAVEIIFKNKIPSNRPEDAHDILATFRIAASRDDMGRSAQDLATFEEFESVLASRHAIIMGARPDKAPGQLKDRPNRAGDTVFVAPDLVRGTLMKGYQMFRSLSRPFDRAAFMMFMVSEIHPFLGGNGRLARIMMNAELVSAQQARIVIPTVYRTDYLLGLRRLTRQREPLVFIRVLVRAQELVHQIDFQNLDRAMAALEKCNAFRDPEEAALRLPSELPSNEAAGR